MLKYFLLPSIFFFQFLNAGGQVNIWNKSLTDSSIAILYAGIDNEIEITSPDKKFDAVTISNSSLNKISHGKYIVKTPKIILRAPADTATIVCTLKGKIVDKKKFAIKYLGRPILKLGNITTAGASVNEMLADTKVTVEFPNCFYKHHYVPLSYRVTIQHEQSRFSYSHFNKKPELYPEQMEILKECKPGTVFTLDHALINDKNKVVDWITSTVIYVR